MLHAGLDLSRKRIDVCVLSEQGELVAELACPPDRDGLRGLARFRLHLVKHRSQLKHRIHSTLMSFGRPRPVSDLFGVMGRELLAKLELPEPWAGNVVASVCLIDSLEGQISEINSRLAAGGGEAMVSYVFKGVYAGNGKGNVDVDGGNAHVRKADLYETTVTFDLTDSKVVADDTYSDESITADVVEAGDKVVVKARLPRRHRAISRTLRSSWWTRRIKQPSSWAALHCGSRAGGL